MQASKGAESIDYVVVEKQSREAGSPCSVNTDATDTTCRSIATNASDCGSYSEYRKLITSNHEEFLFRMKNNTISVSEARAYLHQHPECVFGYDASGVDPQNYNLNRELVLLSLKVRLASQGNKINKQQEHNSSHSAHHHAQRRRSGSGSKMSEFGLSFIEMDSGDEQ